MKLKSEQVKEIQNAVSEALNNMLPRFMGDDIKSQLTSAMEANIGYVDFPDSRTARITLRAEIEKEGEE